MSPIFDNLLKGIGWKTNGDPVKVVVDDAPLTYEQARDLARNSDPDVRQQLARRPDLRPEILYFLADDPVPKVRRQIAANIATPAQADLHLAADSDPSVRGDLAQKIARLAPGLSADERDHLRQMTYETLQLLARDQITRVRQILAEALKDIADAPPSVIRQLAHDSEFVVASPILEFSPVLTDEDLLEIIHTCPTAGALSAISRRKNVGGEVSDRIARSDDNAAIAVLLGNHSAQIREETLDLLLARAPDHDSWHAPLVHRPHLSTKAVTRLARFVADNLLQVLDQRSDFDADTKAAVAAAVRRRVEEAGSDMLAFPHTKAGPDGMPSETMLEYVRRLFDAGQLTEQAILKALGGGETELVVCALAVRAGVSIERVEKIVATQSAKGMVALSWKARLSMPTAVALQTKIAKVPPLETVRPRSGSTDFPMTVDEMLWQLDFFASMVGEGKVDG